MNRDSDGGRPDPRATMTLTGEIEVPVALDDQAGAHRFALLLRHAGLTEVVRLRPKSQLVIGRDFPSHVQIDDPSMSRQHARFTCGTGVEVEDLDSRNGTRVNGARVKRATLVPGDEVRIGATRITLAMSRPAPATRACADGDVAPVLCDARVLELYALARRAARTGVPVLITGETGTGKEHLARMIHSESERCSNPWRAINCAAIPPSLVESVLFGHERGAFSGADKRSRGLFEQASRGTLFLDEVAELPQGVQAALLRVLESKTYQRVGGDEPLHADVRIVAATHCNLDEAVAQRSFRQDLLYRINTVTLELPPLRERPDEIEALVERFIARCNQQWGTQVVAIEPAALTQLRTYSWPGNIRQLRNAIERAALLASNRTLRLADLPGYVREAEHSRPPSPAAQSERDAAPADSNAPSTPTPNPQGAGLRTHLRAYEQQLIEEALRRSGGNRTAAAKLLRVPLRTLFRRLSELGLTDAPAQGRDAEPGS